MQKQTNKIKTQTLLTQTFLIDLGKEKNQLKNHLISDVVEVMHLQGHL